MITLMAAGGLDPLVEDIGWSFLIAGVLALVCDRLRVPSIAAFLLAGLLLGPNGVGMVTDPDNVETMAKIGLVFLLFVVGLEIDLRQLAARGRTVVITGVLQMPLSVLFGYGTFLGAQSLGLLPESFDNRAIIYLGLACGFSSTLIVVKVLQEKALMDTTDGRIALAILVFQDLWAIIVLSLQPALLGDSSGDLMATLEPIARTFAGVAVLVLVGYLCARFILGPIFRRVARFPELIVLTSLAWCFAMGLLGAKTGKLVGLMGLSADISTSMEMGAMVAGAAVATLPYAHEVVSKVGLLRDFFVTLFFVALGMTVDIPRDPMLWVSALVVAVVAMLLRGVVFFPLFALTGLQRQHAVTTSVKMAQVSEFAAVIAFLGLGLGQIGEPVVTVVILAFVGTAVITPALFKQAEKVSAGVDALAQRMGIKGDVKLEETGEGHAPARVVLLGFHRLASALVAEIEQARPGLLEDILVLDINAALHERLKAKGVRAQYGDISNRDSVEHAIESAELVISTIPDDLLRGTNNLAVVKLVKSINPEVRVMAQALRMTDAKILREAGADFVFAWQVEAAHALFPAIEAALNGALSDFDAFRKAEGLSCESREELLDG